MDFFSQKVQEGADLEQNMRIKLEKISPEKIIITKSHRLLLSKILISLSIQ